MLVFVALTAALFMLQCGDTPDADGDTISCILHEDCPVGHSCVSSMGVCGTDTNAFECANDNNCIKGYKCYIDPSDYDGIGKCVPEPVVDGDADKEEPACTSCTIGGGQCNATTEVCYGGCCTLKNAPCPNGVSDCMNGQICADDGLGNLICRDQVTTDEDKVDGDDDVDPDPEPEIEETNPACTNGACDTSDQCSDGNVCGAGGCCVAPCTAGSCSNGATCNTNNGLCEWCDTMCSAGQCCNYHESFWYCGSCCVPPCGDGQACQGGHCVDLTCPTCDPGCECGPSTGYHCDNCPVDGDTDKSGSECLPANATCVEGVDDCCSGTCLMGTCL